MVAKQSRLELNADDTDRVIRLAWEDRSTFEAIRAQFGLSPGDVVKVMRRHLERSAFERWRKRVHKQGQLKNEKTRGVRVDRFKCTRQSIDGITKGSKKRKRSRS